MQFHFYGGYFMILNGVSAALAAASELTLAEKGISAAKVILTGFVVVFSVLLLLIGIIKLYSMIVGKAQSTGVRKKEKPEMPVLVAEREPKDVPSVPSAVSQEDDGVPEEVVAVIAAAVAMMYGGQGRAKIKSIRRAGGRSAWANEGVLDNTRPF